MYSHYHYHYANGSAGCIPDSQETFETKRSAALHAELIFRESICEECFTRMRVILRARLQRKYSCVVFWFGHDENDADASKCFAGADYVEIRRETGRVRSDGSCSC